MSLFFLRFLGYARSLAGETEVFCEEAPQRNGEGNHLCCLLDLNSFLRMRCCILCLINCQINVEMASLYILLCLVVYY